MISIYQRALGSDFSKLHPEIQRRFSLTSEAGVAAIGTGVMDRVWHGAPYTLPFLYVGTWRSIMFPEQGKDVPFSIQNYAYKDPLGRFDAYMIYSEARNCIVDFLGTHQHLAVDIELSVAANGGLRLRSGEPRFYEGPIAFKFPLIFSGIANVCEWYDDQQKCFRIEVDASNRTWGKLFGYSGRFQVEWQPSAAESVPHSILPRRVESRT